MRGKLLIGFVLLVITACNHTDTQNSKHVNALINEDENHLIATAQIENNSGKAHISKVETNLQEEYGWHIVPENVQSLTITVEADNVETILFWISPTGTETWSERSLIGYDINGENGWSFTWEFGDRIFHDHITVQALGEDGVTQATETFNIHSIVDGNNAQ